jgi:hypothetical protein
MNDVRITQSIKEITEKQVCMGGACAPHAYPISGIFTVQWSATGLSFEQLQMFSSLS